MITAKQSEGQTIGKYANVNGIKMYYELHGSGTPLVLLHGGGSTITTTYGKILPMFAKNHQVIAVELQAHGHSSDREAPETFKQDADDVAELLKQLNIKAADILGFSNGGHTALEIAMRHPERVRQLILASMFYKRDGTDPAFWEGMKQAKFSDMPQPYKDIFLGITHDSAALMNMFKKDVQRMQTFRDWTTQELISIKAPALIVIGDKDLTRPEHAVEMHRLLSNSRLAILPGTHGSYLGEILSPDPNSRVPELFVAMVEEFLTDN
jgi:pimeloyl-ACP methyl ester carboxylesterase